MKARKRRRGVTLLELLITIGIMGVLAAISILLIRPDQIMYKRRDAQRISDLNVLAQAINAYIADNGVVPGDDCITSFCASTGCKNTPCTVSKSKLANGSGWIHNSLTSTSPDNCDMTKYISELRIDPVNDNAFLRYFYKTDSNRRKFELDTHLEAKSNTGLMKTDGGDANSYYEVGTDKTII